MLAAAFLMLALAIFISSLVPEERNLILAVFGLMALGDVGLFIWFRSKAKALRGKAPIDWG